jgi:asparagine synthase (glutamine-hydrolysing)
MTAIAGFWSFKGGADAGIRCRPMLDSQRIYGPHASDLWDNGVVALGRSLFRLLPEDIYDRQPLIGGGGRFVLVADVRLDEREELTRALGIDAGEASRMADAALVLAAWERWQGDVFDHLYGDYAFALWDAAEQRLTLARDALGGRPLHYHAGKDFVAFASMPKGLHALDEIPTAPDEERSLQFLALMAETGPRSFFEGVSRVELGQIVTFDRNGMTARTHWQPSGRKLDLAGGADAYAEALRHHLDRAVAARLRGAGDRVGAHLSGGLDSPAVAATAARIMGAQGGKVVAFTAVPRQGYDGPAPEGAFGDESSLAADTAALYSNIEHVLVRPDGRTVLDQLDRDFYLFERPLANAQVWQFWNRINAEAQQRGVSVLLTGAMGNATMSYNGAHLFSELAREQRYLRLFREGRDMVRSGRGRWIGVLGNAYGPHIPKPVWSALHRWRRGVRTGLAPLTMIRPDRFGELEAIEGANGSDFSYRPRPRAFDSRLWGLRRIDFGNNRKGVLAGWGVDMRDPTVDRRLVEFCLSVPTEQYLAAGVPRALMRRAFADRLPASLLDERRRGAQALDWHEGLTADRERIREEIDRLAQIPSAAASLDLERMRQMVDAWPAGGWHNRQVEVDYCYLLLRGVVSGQFLRKATRTNA